MRRDTSLHVKVKLQENKTTSRHGLTFLELPGEQPSMFSFATSNESVFAQWEPSELDSLKLDLSKMIDAVNKINTTLSSSTTAATANLFPSIGGKSRPTPAMSLPSTRCWQPHFPSTSEQQGADTYQQNSYPPTGPMVRATTTESFNSEEDEGGEDNDFEDEIPSRQPQANRVIDPSLVRRQPSTSSVMIQASLSPAFGRGGGKKGSGSSKRNRMSSKIPSKGNKSGGSKQKGSGRRRKRKTGNNNSDEDDLELTGGSTTKSGNQPVSSYTQNFWNAMECYFRNFNDDDFKLLKQPSEEEINRICQIPILGRNYHEEWAIEDENDQQDTISPTITTANSSIKIEQTSNSSNLVRQKSSKHATRLSTLKTENSGDFADSSDENNIFVGDLTQKLLSSLLEIPNLSNVVEFTPLISLNNSNNSNNNNSNNNNNNNTTQNQQSNEEIKEHRNAMEDAIRSQLISLEILEPSDQKQQQQQQQSGDSSLATNEDDEICGELRDYFKIYRRTLQNSAALKASLVQKAKAMMKENEQREKELISVRQAIENYKKIAKRKKRTSMTSTSTSSAVITPAPSTTNTAVVTQPITPSISVSNLPIENITQ